MTDTEEKIVWADDEVTDDYDDELVSSSLCSHTIPSESTKRNSDLSETSSNAGKQTVRLCKYFLNGYCYKTADECIYLHSMPNTLECHNITNYGVCKKEKCEFVHKKISEECPEYLKRGFCGYNINDKLYFGYGFCAMFHDPAKSSKNKPCPHQHCTFGDKCIYNHSIQTDKKTQHDKKTIPKKECVITIHKSFDSSIRPWTKNPKIIPKVHDEVPIEVHHDVHIDIPIENPTESSTHENNDVQDDTQHDAHEETVHLEEYSNIDVTENRLFEQMDTFLIIAFLNDCTKNGKINIGLYNEKQKDNPTFVEHVVSSCKKIRMDNNFCDDEMSERMDRLLAIVFMSECMENGKISHDIVAQKMKSDTVFTRHMINVCTQIRRK